MPRVWGEWEYSYIAFEGWAGPSSYSRRHRHLYNQMSIFPHFLFIYKYLQTLPEEWHNRLLIRTQTWDRLHAGQHKLFTNRSSDPIPYPKHPHSYTEKDSHLSAKLPPVKKPEMMAFHGSSFCLYPLTAQSKVEKRPPQTPKLPPSTGARALIAERDPTRRSPCGCVR